jgi:hypothetical protein
LIRLKVRLDLLIKKKKIIQLVNRKLGENYHNKITCQLLPKHETP